MKQTIKLNESQLKKIVAESVKGVLKENIFDDAEMYKFGSEQFREKQKKQDRIDIDACKVKLNPIIADLYKKYGDLVYSALMEIAETINPNSED